MFMSCCCLSTRFHIQFLCMEIPIQFKNQMIMVVVRMTVNGCFFHFFPPLSPFSIVRTPLSIHTQNRCGEGGWGWGGSHNMFSSSSFSYIHTITVSTRWLLATSLKYLKFTNPHTSYTLLKYFYTPLCTVILCSLEDIQIQEPLSLCTHALWLRHWNT